MPAKIFKTFLVRLKNGQNHTSFRLCTRNASWDLACSASGPDEGQKIAIYGCLALIGRDWKESTDDAISVKESSLPSAHYYPLYITDETAVLCEKREDTSLIRINAGSRSYDLDVPSPVVNIDCDGRACRNLIRHVCRDWDEICPPNERKDVLSWYLENMPDAFLQRYSIRIRCLEEPMLVLSGPDAPPSTF